MNNRVRNIQCLVWLVAASIVIARFDARVGDTARELPRVRLQAVADTRATPSGGIASAVPFGGFELPRAVRDSIVRLARAQVGRRYHFGGTTPDRGFDCSGLVRYVLAQLHLSLPRVAAQQARVGQAVPREALQPGDLLSFGERDRVSHIGIYIGDGKYVHASSVAGRVIVSRLDRQGSRLIRPLRGARRLYALGGASTGSGSD